MQQSARSAARAEHGPSGRASACRSAQITGDERLNRASSRSQRVYLDLRPCRCRRRDHLPLPNGQERSRNCSNRWAHSRDARAIARLPRPTRPGPRNIGRCVRCATKRQPPLCDVALLRHPAVAAEGQPADAEETLLARAEHGGLALCRIWTSDAAEPSVGERRFILERTPTPLGEAVLVSDLEGALRLFYWEDPSHRWKAALKQRYGEVTLSKNAFGHARLPRAYFLMATSPRSMRCKLHDLRAPRSRARSGMRCAGSRAGQPPPMARWRRDPRQAGPRCAPSASPTDEPVAAGRPTSAIA